VDSIMELAERANAWQLRAVCRHFLRNRGAAGLLLAGAEGANGQNGGDAMDMEEGEEA